MKIISGKYKGRNLLGFNIDGTRPTMDRVKESLFAMIQHYIDGADVLDLFAGSGNLGIEALSEGADVAYLVDKNRKACKIIQSNLHNLKIESANVFCMDYLQAIKIVLTSFLLTLLIKQSWLRRVLKVLFNWMF